MSKAAVEQVIQKAMSDEQFRASLKKDPQAALAGYDLTSAERAHFSSGNPSQLQAIGVDERITKSAIDMFGGNYPWGGPQNQ
jgi:hypothetical protein